MTRDLLLPSFDAVDLLEQSPRLIAAAPAYIGEQASRVTFLCQGMQVRTHSLAAGGLSLAFLQSGRADDGERWPVRVQDFSAEAGTYDVVWIQWCIGHLHDVDLVKFLQRMKPVSEGRASEGGREGRKGVLLPLGDAACMEDG